MHTVIVRQSAMKLIALVLVVTISALSSAHGELQQNDFYFEDGSVTTKLSHIPLEPTATTPSPLNPPLKHKKNQHKQHELKFSSPPSFFKSPPQPKPISPPLSPKHVSPSQLPKPISPPSPSVPPIISNPPRSPQTPTPSPTLDYSSPSPLQYNSPPPPSFHPVSQPPPPPPEPWGTHYMNLYTPADPPGGLVVSADGMHVDVKITSTQQIFGHFLSKYRFIYGYFSIYMKMIPNDSAGTIMTYYFSSPEKQNKSEDTHDECDFEFLGNVSGQPITLQTNVYLNGRANREIRHYLPFDPTADFHKYSLLWNENLIVWYVDDQVIRVHHNRSGVPYPTSRPMAVQASLWNGSEWATQGGSVKLNISNVPFVLQYEGFNGVDGCRACNSYPMTDPSSACADDLDLSQCSSGHWFNEKTELTTAEVAHLQAHTDQYVVYHYCKDYNRFPNGFPPECAYNFALSHNSH